MKKLKTYWTIFKDGKPEPIVCESEKSLLIGYDLIPLRGLDKCKERLLAKGMMPTEVRVEGAEDGVYWAYEKAGVLMLQGEGLGDTEERALGTAAQYESLPWYWFGKWGNISPKRTENLRVKSKAELKIRGIKAVKVNLIPA